MSGMQKQQQQKAAKAAGKAKKQEQKNAQQVNARQMLDAPETLRSEDVLAAQQQVGNQVVQRTLGKEKQDAAATDEQGNLRPELASTIQQKRGGGKALPEGVRKEAHKVLGKEFKNVRIHTDSTSDQLSRSVSARAFTIGSDIFFKSGVFAPGTNKGRETLMHELTHVVQQSGSSKSPGGKLKLGASGTAMEKEADHIGKKHAQAKVGATASAIGTVQKAPLDDEELIQGAPEEEEELQMQPDAGNVVQRVEDEELIQGAPEEEELQMQPDAGNLVQRTGDDDDVWTGGKLNYKKYSQKVLGGHRVAPGIRKQVEMFGGSIGQHRNGSGETTTQQTTPKRSLNTRPKPQVSVRKPQIGSTKSQDVGTETQTTNTGTGTTNTGTQKTNTGTQTTNTDTETTNTGTQTTNTDSETTNTGTQPTLKRTRRSLNLRKPSKPLPKRNSTIPDAPPLPVQQQKKQEGPLSFSDQIKAKSKSMRSNSQRENLANLEQDRQQKVGTRVSEQYMEDQANKPKSKWSRFKGFAKKAGGTALKYAGMAGVAALGKVGSTIKGQFTQAKEQFFGKSEKKPEKTPEAPHPSVTVNVGSSGSGNGGGGGGGGGMAETISELFQENKKLKAQIAELEKE